MKYTLPSQGLRSANRLIIIVCLILLMAIGVLITKSCKTTIMPPVKEVEQLNDPRRLWNDCKGERQMVMTERNISVSCTENKKW